MQNSTDMTGERDREIARHFARMREADARQAPPVPDPGALAQRRRVVVANRLSAPLPKVAAAVFLAVGAGLLLLDTAPGDPGVLYADIMGNSQLITDPLLSVSPGTLPENLDALDALDMELALPELN